MDNPPATPQNGNPPALTGQVLFYKQPQPLAPEDHGGLGVKQIAEPFGFLREAHAVPVTVTEFGLAAACYPIIFVGAEKTPVAVMGIRQGQNLYVDATGRVPEDYYLPAFVRRYPFVFAADEASDRLVLCVDRAAPMVTNQPEVPFFENGQPTKFTNDAVEFCKEFERQRRATTDFVKMLTDLDLLEQKTVNFQPRDNAGNDAGPQQKIADYFAISEERMNALPAEKYLELRGNGAVGACYAHLVSLLNWQRVIQRALRMQPENAQPAPAN
ncbi:SapC family protein [Hyphomonas johnsonii]|uniref:SapC family protein n=1 Tax=Hyphomonas johnsonii MHS-2 TaxID=1280950 RepID=A0A059FPA8_9PROT|nr:SapC family protein [Hyphomonas johnsonii]KCZ92452.1 SapC family protein [Hyphomonas johnsonii MHS-2]